MHKRGYLKVFHFSWIISKSEVFKYAGPLKYQAEILIQGKLLNLWKSKVSNLMSSIDSHSCQIGKYLQLISPEVQ